MRSGPSAAAASTAACTSAAEVTSVGENRRAAELLGQRFALLRVAVDDHRARARCDQSPHRRFAQSRAPPVTNATAPSIFIGPPSLRPRSARCTAGQRRVRVAEYHHRPSPSRRFTLTVPAGLEPHVAPPVRHRRVRRVQLAVDHDHRGGHPGRANRCSAPSIERPARPPRSIPMRRAFYYHRRWHDETPRAHRRRRAERAHAAEIGVRAARLGFRHRRNGRVRALAGSFRAALKLCGARPTRTCPG